MTKQDFYTVENEDRGKPLPLNEKKGSNVQEDAIVSSSKIKNAHAAGTGAIGCNESCLPEEEKEQSEKTY